MDGDTDPPWVRWRLWCSLDSNRVAGLRLVIVGGFVLRRCDIVEGAVKPDGVEPGDPAEGGELDVVDALPGALAGTAEVRKAGDCRALRRRSERWSATPAA